MSAHPDDVLPGCEPTEKLEACVPALPKPLEIETTEDSLLITQICAGCGDVFVRQFDTGREMNQKALGAQSRIEILIAIQNYILARRAARELERHG